MSEDMEKLHLIHRVKNTFLVNDSDIHKLLKEVDTDKRKDAERVFSSLAVEDRFGLLYGSLPWVHLLHGLQQKQLPDSSKQEYQVPDYLLFFEASSQKHVPFLVDVKWSSGMKTTLEIMKRQFEGLQSYASVLGIDWVLAIYWERARLWTLNAPDILEAKTKKFKISLERSLKNDLSVILGDLTFVVPQLFRVTIFDSSVTDGSRPTHGKYGAVVSDRAGLSETTLSDIEPVQSAIIDSYMEMEEKRSTSEGKRTELLESSKDTYMLKLSTIIMHHLGTMHAEITNQDALKSRASVVEFMKKLGVIQSFAIPSQRSPISDSLYRQAFEGTWVWDDYLRVSASSIIPGT